MPQELLDTINDLDSKLREMVTIATQPGITSSTMVGADIGDRARDNLSREVDNNIYYFQLVMNQFNLGFYPLFVMKSQDEDKIKYYLEDSIVGANSPHDEGDHQDYVAPYLASLFEIDWDTAFDGVLIGPNMEKIYEIVDVMISNGAFRDDVRLYFLKNQYGIDFPKNQLEFKSKGSLVKLIHKELQGKTVKTDGGNVMPAYDHLLKSLEEKLLLLV